MLRCCANTSTASVSRSRDSASAPPPFRPKLPSGRGRPSKSPRRRLLASLVNEDHSAVFSGLGKIQSLDRARQGSLEPGSYRHTTIRRSSRPRQ